MGWRIHFQRSQPPTLPEQHGVRSQTSTAERLWILQYPPHIFRAPRNPGAWQETQTGHPEYRRSTLVQGCCPGIGLLSLRGKFGPQVDISYQMNRHVMRHGTVYIVTDVHLLLAPVMTDTRSLGLEPKHQQPPEFWNRSISNGEQRPGFGSPGLPGLCQAHCKPTRSAQPYAIRLSGIIIAYRGTESISYLMPLRR